MTVICRSWLKSRWLKCRLVIDRSGKTLSCLSVSQVNAEVWQPTYGDSCRLVMFRCRQFPAFIHCCSKARIVMHCTAISPSCLLCLPPCPVPGMQPPLPPATVRELVRSCLHRDPVAADLRCSLFVAAALTYKRDSVLRPFPRRYTSEDSKEFEALVSLWSWPEKDSGHLTFLNQCNSSWYSSRYCIC